MPPGDNPIAVNNNNNNNNNNNYKFRIRVLGWTLQTYRNFLTTVHLGLLHNAQLAVKQKLWLSWFYICHGERTAIVALLSIRFNLQQKIRVRYVYPYFSLFLGEFNFQTSPIALPVDTILPVVYC